MWEEYSQNRVGRGQRILKEETDIGNRQGASTHCACGGFVWYGFVALSQALGPAVQVWRLHEDIWAPALRTVLWHWVHSGHSRIFIAEVATDLHFREHQKGTLEHRQQILWWPLPPLSKHLCRPQGHSEPNSRLWDMGTNTITLHVLCETLKKWTE